MIFIRILVVSDTHGDYWSLDRAVSEQPNADTIIHLGDGEREFDSLKEIYPKKDIRFVAGNCDFASLAPHSDETILSSKRIFYTHGHDYYVKHGLSQLMSEGRSRKADIILYGHTHVAYTSYEDGMYIMNPGSLGHPRDGKATYGVIDITPAGIVLNVVLL